jgi:hypothetical protein
VTVAEHPFGLARDVILTAILDLEDQVDQLHRALALLDHPASQPPTLVVVPHERTWSPGDPDVLPPVESDPTPPHGLERPEPVPPRTWEPVECPVCGRECHPNGIGPHMRKHANEEPADVVGNVATFDPDAAREAAARSAFGP